MVKLDVTLLRYLSAEDFKILTSVEMGMKNHELVPGPLINSIATLRYGGSGKILVDLTKHKLLAYERGKRYDGYRLTYHGYDFLALNALTHREVLGGVGNQIGVGKESDVFICQSPDQTTNYAIKFHRLGRTCFRKVSEKRDFYTKSKNKTSWIYLSRKAAQREYEFMRYMHCKKLPVPKPIDHNRHVVVMELIDGHLLNHFTMDSFEETNRDKIIANLYDKLMELILRFANETRVIHGDFNEFNIIIKNEKSGTCEELVPIIIDLPQMLGLDHELAPEYFERDVNCIVEFFAKRFRYTSDNIPTWDDIDVVREEPDAMELFLKDVLESADVEDNPEENTRSASNLNEIQAQVGKVDDAELSINLQVINEDSQDTQLDAIVDHDRSSDEQCSESDIPDEAADLDDCMSQFSAITISRDEARRKLRAELIKKEMNKKKRQAAKPKNIKGEANPVRRRRKTNQQISAEDAASYGDCF